MSIKTSKNSYINRKLKKCYKLKKISLSIDFTRVLNIFLIKKLTVLTLFNKTQLTDNVSIKVFE
jgi:hypothetical protein